MLTNTIRLMAWRLALCLPAVGEAISLGNLTFSLGAEESFAAKRVLNNNTWFKLLIKPGCSATEEGGDAWYLRPGDLVRQAALRKPGDKYIIYNDRFIKISNDCP